MFTRERIPKNMVLYPLVRTCCYVQSHCHESVRCTDGGNRQNAQGELPE